MSIFHDVFDRKNTHSVKWDHVDQLFGGEALLPMWVADMDFKAPQPVLDALGERIAHGIFGYSKATEQTREAITTWLQRKHGWTVDPEWLVFTAGIVPAIAAAIQTYTKEGDGILLQSPVYYPFSNLITKNKRTLYDSPLQFDGQQYTIDFRDLEEKMASGHIKMMLLCSPHNPIGRVWRKDELTQLAKLCIQYEVLLFADEIHHDLVYSNYEHTVVSSLNEEIEQRTLTGIAPSKTFNLAGLQFSALIIPNKKRRQLFIEHLEKNGFSSPGALGIVAAEAAYQHGEAWLNELLLYLEENIAYLKTFIAERLPEITVIEPEGTYLVWLDCRKLSIDFKALEAVMQKEAGLALDEGYIFGTNGQGFERMNIACPLETLKEGLNRLETAVNRIKTRL
ncbi:MalY/PatB family protein [Fictibacillus macauensis]|uniref:MalY/PatB family protein n=1 Tax=Fictibacillus macauensis TaxID=245160 RepID=UPI0002D8EE9F|nr:MalY/PatB family protein [Fictibacillus macauensis]